MNVPPDKDSKYVLVIDMTLSRMAGDWRLKHVLQHEIVDATRTVTETRTFKFLDRTVRYVHHASKQAREFSFDDIDMKTIPDIYKPMFGKDEPSTGPHYEAYFCTQADIERAAQEHLDAQAESNKISVVLQQPIKIFSRPLRLNGRR